MDPISVGTSVTHPYTCLSCSLAFVDAASQREHYATDLHRYNSKRRVAGLGPVTAEVYNEKVLAVKALDGVEEQEQEDKKLSCKACRKTFASAATYNAHNLSKKHKENVFRQAAAVKVSDLQLQADAPDSAGEIPSVATSDVAMADGEATPVPSTSAVPAEVTAAAEVPFESSGDAKLDLLVARRLRSSPPIAPSSCLFCTHSSASAAENAVHMRHAHGFTIPEEEYLVDLEGLLRRLGEEVGTWNVCICCGKGYGGNINLDEPESRTDDDRRKRASKGVEAVRAHMHSKSHCRIPYDTEAQQLDLADFYDFRPSYPDYAARQARKAARRAARMQTKEGDAVMDEAGEWEDDADADGSEGDDDIQVVYEVTDEPATSDSEYDSDEDIPSGNGITYGDSQYELVLASGARIGHRKHAYIHKQNIQPYLDQNPFKPSRHSNPDKDFVPSARSQALLSLVQMPKDKAHSNTLKLRSMQDAALIPAKGAGFSGAGEVIKARNRGEARHAQKGTGEVQENRRFQVFALKRAIKSNNQKHFRDHLLQ